MGKMLVRGVLVLVSIAVLFAEPACSQLDLTLQPEASGTAVVEATVSKIDRLAALSRDLRDDNRFIRRIAWVETDDGTAPSTYSDDAYHGGIWKVDQSVFDITVGLYNDGTYSSIFEDILKILNINWARSAWQDCRKPLYSALAAQLFFHSLQANIPQGLNGQATLWRNRYHSQPTDTVDEFIRKVNILESEGCTVQGIDLVFVLDSSGSVGSTNFETTKNFVSTVTDHFDIDADKTRVGVIKYSSDVTVEFNLDNYTDKAQLQQAIGNIGYSGGSTQTVTALETMESQAFLVENGARPDSKAIPRVAVVITDGRSQGAEAVAVPADRAREKGITIFAIGVTDSVNQDEINAIANEPNDTYVFHVSRFDNIDNIVATLEDRTCNDPTPIRVPVINNTISLGDKQYLQQAVPETGITLGIEAAEGDVVMYVSTSTPNPNEALHDYRLEATEGQGRVEVFIDPELYKNEGNFSQETGGGGRNRRQAPSQNDTEDGSPIGTVYMTIEGLQDTNDFVLEVTEGDVTESEPTTEGDVTEPDPTTEGDVTEPVTPTSGAATEATAYASFTALVATLLVKCTLV